MDYIEFNSNVMGILQNKTQVNSYENITLFIIYSLFLSKFFLLLTCLLL